mgnify:CR=1 FL=1
MNRLPIDDVLPALRAALADSLDGVDPNRTARILTEDADILRDRVGADLELTGIAVRDTGATRDWQADPALYTTDAEALVDGADVVIESTGIFTDAEKAKALVARLARDFPREHEPCPIGSDRALDTALITAPAARDLHLLAKLDAVAGRVLGA